MPHLPPSHRLHSGTTLLELVLVLLIVALLLGAVLFARDLQNAAMVRQVIGEVEAIHTAIHTFQGKFDAWPGDFSLASQYWAGTTSDGDGDSIIYMDNLGGGEHLRFWQHLSLAGLIRGQLSGVPGSHCTEAIYVPAMNIPATLYSPIGGYVVWDNSGAPLSLDSRAPATKYLVLGATLVPPACSWAFVAGLLEASHGRSVDGKIDDGIAFSGNTLGLTGTTRQLVHFPEQPCGTPVLDGLPEDDYATAQGSGKCLMLFVLSR